MEHFGGKVVENIRRKIFGENIWWNIFGGYACIYHQTFNIVDRGSYACTTSEIAQSACGRWTLDTVHWTGRYLQCIQYLSKCIRVLHLFRASSAFLSLSLCRLKILHTRYCFMLGSIKSSSLRFSSFSWREQLNSYTNETAF